MCESCIRSIVLREPIVAKEKDKARSTAMAKMMDGRGAMAMA